MWMTRRKAALKVDAFTLSSLIIMSSAIWHMSALVQSIVSNTSRSGTTFTVGAVTEITPLKYESEATNTSACERDNACTMSSRHR